MRTHLIPTFLVLMSTALVAQAPQNVKALVCDGPAVCTRSYVNGREVFMLSSDNVVVVASVQVLQKYTVADVLVLNSSSAPVDVLPNNFVLVEMTPKQKPLKPVDADKIIRKIEGRAAWANAFTAMAGNMARQQSATTTTTTGTINANSNGTTAVGTYSGSSTARTSTPDYAAQARAAETIRARREATTSLTGFLSSVVLRANTISPTQNVRGYVVFERDKNEHLVMLSGIVGDTIYQFPFLVAGR